MSHKTTYNQSYVIDNQLCLIKPIYNQVCALNNKVAHRKYTYNWLSPWEDPLLPRSTHHHYSHWLRRGHPSAYNARTQYWSTIHKCTWGHKGKHMCARHKGQDVKDSELANLSSHLFTNLVMQTCVSPANPSPCKVHQWKQTRYKREVVSYDEYKIWFILLCCSQAQIIFFLKNGLKA